MTEEFKQWFDKTFPPHMWPNEEERQEVMIYTWLAWRDGIRSKEAQEEEPIVYIFKHPAGKLFWALTDESNKDHDDVIPVYTKSNVKDQSDDNVQHMG